MKFVLHKVTVVISACVLVMSTHMPAARAQSPVAQVEQGALAGVTVDGISSFKGIPFAAPPVGELRWQAPQPADVWAGTRNANAYGNACIQPVVQSLEGSEPVGAQSEDCLYLNVWTAGADPNAKRPVMVWIHGGAYNVGAGGLKMYDGTALAKRGAVLVNFNYRVGSLGFFAHPALEQASPNGPINFGLLDQIAALQWVKKNIATFGGDPNNVTIFGESAGGQSVLALYASPLAKGLFQRGIAQSSYGIPEAPRTKALEVGANVANAIGLNGANATLSELRAVPAEKFAQSRGGNLSLAPVPAYGDSVLPRTTLDTFSNGESD
jgi:para-nitrobenzyl esterase